MKMPKVIDCNAKTCVYNKDFKCHTYAINIGDSEPICDTFMESEKKSGTFQTGGVGSCKVDTCTYNDSLECTAQGIHVKVQNGHADCTSFLTN